VLRERATERGPSLRTAMLRITADSEHEIGRLERLTGLAETGHWRGHSVPVLAAKQQHRAAATAARNPSEHIERESGSVASGGEGQPPLSVEKDAGMRALARSAKGKKRRRGS